MKRGQSRLWMIPLALALLIIAFVAVIPPGYKEALIGKIENESGLNLSANLTYEQSVSQIISQKEYPINVIYYKEGVLIGKYDYSIFLIDSPIKILDFKTEILKPITISLKANIFDTSNAKYSLSINTKNVQSDCSVFLHVKSIESTGNVVVKDNGAVIFTIPSQKTIEKDIPLSPGTIHNIVVELSPPKNPLRESSFLGEISVYKSCKNSLKVSLDLKNCNLPKLMVHSLEGGCELKIGNDIVQLENCSLENLLIPENANELEIVPLKDSLELAEIAIVCKYPEENKFIDTFVVDSLGNYYLTVIRESGSFRLSINDKEFIIIKTSEKINITKYLTPGTNVISISPLGDYSKIKLIKIEKII